MPTIAKRGQGLFVTAAATHAVGIHPNAWMIREPRPHFGLELLRAKAAEANSFETTIGARGWRLGVIIAVVAHCRVVMPMKCERQITLRTLHGVSACRALDVR